MKKFSKLISFLLAAAVLCGLLCSCGGKDEPKKSSFSDDESKHVNLTWYIRTTEPEGFKDVMEKANEYLNDKLNVTLDLRCVEPGDYASKLQLAAASGESFDLVWTARWANNYEQNVTKNAFMAIDEILDMPELSYIKNLYAEGIWDACRVNGKIYGVPVEQVIYNQDGIWLQKSYMEKYGINPYDQLKTTDDLEDIYQTVHDGEQNLIMCTSGNRVWDVRKVDIAGGWYFDENSNITDLEDAKDHGLDWAKRMREWNVKGFFPADIATFSEEDSYLKQGKILSRYDRYLPGSEGKTRITYGYDVCHVPTSGKLITRNSVQSTLTAVSYTSKNPVRAVKLIQLMHQDEYLLNLICYGIEGRDYTKDPENPKRMIRESGGYYISEFMIGSQFLAYLVPSYEDGVWEETKKENAAADIDPNIGFSFDRSVVETEISNVSSAGKEYAGLGSGLYENYEEMYLERCEKIKLAGSEIIKEEIERQYKEWKESK